MKSPKKISNLDLLKTYMHAFIVLLIMNNLVVIGSEYKSDFQKSKKMEGKFEKIFFKNSIPYASYDNLENQLKTFLGFYSYRAENSFYPDLSIISESDLLREIYRAKLNNMTMNKIINIEK